MKPTHPFDDPDHPLQQGLDQLVTFAERVSTIFDPQWKARTDVLKTIITLSSGSIVLTVGFSSSLRSLAVGAPWKQFVLVSFTLLLFSLLLAFVALRFSAKVYELSANVFSMKLVLPDLLKQSSSLEGFDKRWERIQKEAFEPIKTSDDWAIRLYKASSVCFCTAILLLGVIGFRQLSL
jgi:hypothetical protein